MNNIQFCLFVCYRLIKALKYAFIAIKGFMVKLKKNCVLHIVHRNVNKKSKFNFSFDLADFCKREEGIKTLFCLPQTIFHIKREINIYN